MPDLRTHQWPRLADHWHIPERACPPATLDTALEVLLNPAFSYNPSTQGAITSLSASVDKNLSVNIALTGGGNTFHPTILQGGVLYVASVSGPGLNCPTGACATGYQQHRVQSHGGRLPVVRRGDQHVRHGTPNFAGGPMEFGLTQIFGAGAAEVIIADYANLAIAINAPEPASLALLGISLLGLVAVRWRIVGCGC